MAVNVEALKSPTALLKYLQWCLTVIVLILARAGFDGDEILHPSDDNRWLVSITVVSSAMILSITIVCYFLGENLPPKMDALYMLLLGILYLAAGSVSIQAYEKASSDYRRDTALAMGSLGIINGIVMILNVLVLIKPAMGK